MSATMMMQLVVSRVALVSRSAAAERASAAYSALTSSSWAEKVGSSPLESGESATLTWLPGRCASASCPRQPSSAPDLMSRQTLAQRRRAGQDPVEVAAHHGGAPVVEQLQGGVVGVDDLEPVAPQHQQHHAGHRLGEVAAEEPLALGELGQRLGPLGDRQRQRERHQGGREDVALHEGRGELQRDAATHVAERAAALGGQHHRHQARQQQLQGDRAGVEPQRRPDQERQHGERHRQRVERTEDDHDRHDQRRHLRGVLGPARRARSGAATPSPPARSPWWPRCGRRPGCAASAGTRPRPAPSPPWRRSARGPRHPRARPRAAVRSRRAG